MCFQRLSNGSIDPDSEVNRVIELQETVEKQNSELTATRTKNLEMTNKITELEESLQTTQKDLVKAQDQLVKLQRDLREVSEHYQDLMLVMFFVLNSVSAYAVSIATFQNKFEQIFKQVSLKFHNVKVDNKIDLVL